MGRVAAVRVGIAIAFAIGCKDKPATEPGSVAVTVTDSVPVSDSVSEPVSDSVPVPDLRAAVDRAAVWLASFPPDALRFDAAIGLAQVVRKADSEPARRAFAAARAVADRDHDSPLRRA